MRNHSSIKKIYKPALLCFILAVFIIIPFIVLNDGILTLCEDFNAETIPYLFHIHDTIYNFDFGWDWFFDLGGDSLQSLAAIGAFNPTTLLNALLPRNLILYALPWFVILRLTIMGCGAYLYLSRYVKKDNTALIGSVLYTFSGYTACSFVFNFVNDAFVIFPLALWGLDELVIQNKRGIFAFLIFITALSSPSTLIMEVIFYAFYFSVRFGVKNYKEFVRCIIEGTLGVLMASLTFLPQVLTLLSSNRTASGKLIGNSWFSFSSKDLLLWLRALILPSETMSNSSSVVRIDWTGNAAYLSLIGLTLCIAFILKKNKEKNNEWIHRMILCELIISLVPFLNNIFMLEMAFPYRRWYSFGIVFLVLASIIVLEDKEKYSIRKACLIEGICIAFYVFVLFFLKWDENGTLPIFSLKRIGIRIFLATIGVVIVFSFAKTEKPLINNKCLFSLICLFSVICNSLVLYEYKGISDNTIEENKTTQIINELFNTGEGLNGTTNILPYRVIYDKPYYNYGMIDRYPTRTSFISIVSPSIEKFYMLLGNSRNNISPIGFIGTSELLSAKYYFLEAESEELSLIKTYNNGVHNVYLYEDEYTLPIGYTYDSYITETELSNVAPQNRSALALSSLVIPDEKENEISHYLFHNTEEFTEDFNNNDIRNFQQSHLSETCTNFEYSSKQFSCNLNVDEKKFAFFSVPFSEQWKAYVNGEKVEIVDCLGMMAIPMTEGSNSIVFKYNPIENLICLTISLVFITAFIVYVFVSRKNIQKQRV